MFDLVDLFVVAVALAVTLAIITVWSRRRFWVKTAAVVVTAIFLPLAYAAFADLLSKPKPVGLEWAHRNIAEATVIAATLREGEGIFLWLELDGVAEPRAYVLPWNRELAQQLQEAQREARANRNGLRMRLPFDPSLDQQEQKFYATPQRATPPKDRNDDGPLIYRHPEQSA